MVGNATYDLCRGQFDSKIAKRAGHQTLQYTTIQRILVRTQLWEHFRQEYGIGSASSSSGSRYRPRKTISHHASPSVDVQVLLSTVLACCSWVFKCP
ncbi:hypothetical protein AVEN_143422-1 [Araneus ventricosus]|uniref:Uncharacterized protein n=1 Tax=Araneus ventricosus TaxID=182803 RepID=A0A4Y2AFN7_ARAVE|nr:hypothetical protein AVEN_143422-1 [Araneus ventricosus]